MSGNLQKPPKFKWTRKNRVLLVAERGISYRVRHLLRDLAAIMPHSKTDQKLDKNITVDDINDVKAFENFYDLKKLCELRNCNRCILIQTKKNKDVYMWMSHIGSGPAVKFLVENIHTIDELGFRGNCMKGSRPILSFSKDFERKSKECSYIRLLKRMFVHVFGVPFAHPRSKPFIDHTMLFSLLDNKIWIRNYQIVYDQSSNNGSKPVEMIEIGPRLVLTPIVLFSGSFSGQILYKNSTYISPNIKRSIEKKKNAMKKKIKYVSNVFRDEEQKNRIYQKDEIDNVFNEAE